MSSSSANINVYKLHKLQIGMTQEDVYEVMRYPMKEDQITTQDGCCYDIWFYLTRATILGQSEEVPRNLTPLIFKDGIFVGMGYDYYNWVIQKTKISKEKEEVPPVKNERENFELEKSLTPPHKASPKPVSVEDSLDLIQIDNKTISMSSKPKQVQKQEKAPEEKSQSEDEKEENSSKVKMDKEDRELLEQEQEENFNDW